MQETLESLSVADHGIRHRVDMGRRHAMRDRVFLHSLGRYLRPGPILELGASTGHLAVILKEQGHKVIASEIETKLIQAIAARGLEAVLVDATQDIVAQTGCTFPNILAQAISPLIRRDRDRVLATLRYIHAALGPSGRFINIGPYAWRQQDPKSFFSPREQIEFTRSCGLFRMIACYPHQVLPPRLYRPWNAKVLNMLDHKLAYIASARLVWVAEKIES